LVGLSGPAGTIAKAEGLRTERIDLVYRVVVGVGEQVDTAAPYPELVPLDKSAKARAIVAILQLTEADILLRPAN
jgi:hypothetical protein